MIREMVTWIKWNKWRSVLKSKSLRKLTICLLFAQSSQWNGTSREPYKVNIILKTQGMNKHEILHELWLTMSKKCLKERFDDE